MLSLGKWFRLKRRQKRARKLGFDFKRSAGFRPPVKIKINGRDFPISYPEEVGVINDFLSIFLDDDYRLERVNWPVKTVLDIGANLGFFSIAARNAFPEATIHAYEPNEDLDRYLVPHSKEGKFKLHREAVGLESGRVSLDIRGETNQTRSKADDTGGIPQVAFRETIERLGGQVDVAKVDCEGAEWEFLEDKEAWQKVRFLAMEYHLWPGNRGHYDIQMILREQGFHILQARPIEDYGLVYAIRI
jgi:FkbM family methyltransferase